MKNPFETILNPRSIAVIGASRSPSKVGHQVVQNILAAGFKGQIYPVNPNAQKILNLPCYPTIGHLPKSPDVAVIVTPAPLVPTILLECGRKKIKNAIVITAGFAEVGPKGKLLQHELSLAAQKSGVRLIGPNCLGVLSPTNQLNATFGPKLPKKGNIMLISQSGALVTGILDWAKKHNMGLSHAVTLGNRLDLGEIEALEFAALDKNTDIIMVYLESFQNAPEFFSLCSEVTPLKPVILLKGGQSSAGQTASASHTAALASNYTLVKSFAKQTGVIVTDTLKNWLNLASAFARTKPIVGNDIAIITNAGGPGVLTTDEATDANLKLAPLNKRVKTELKAALSDITPHNPLDILGDALPDEFATALRIVATDPEPDSLLVIITPQTTTKPLETAHLIADTSRKLNKPIFAILLGGEKMDPAARVLENAGIPTYVYPTEAIEIIAAKALYETQRQNIFIYPGSKPRIIPKKKLKPKTEITLEWCLTLLRNYGLTVPTSKIITKVSDIPQTLRATGYPAVLKTAHMHLAHKAAVGGVMLGIMNAHQARLGFNKLQTLYPRVLFQQTIHGNLELIIGAKRDAQLGPFITVGLGGSLTNTLEDRAYAFLPAQRSYLIHMLETTKAFRALNHEELPVKPVIDTLERVSRILLDYPEIQELEINPVIVTHSKVYCADIKIVQSQFT